MPENHPDLINEHLLNRTVFTGDNLDILRGFDDGSVDLIYLDPPFNSNRDYAAPVGSAAAGAAFKDTWTLSDVDLAEHGEIADREPALYEVIRASRLAHGDGMMSYLVMMSSRLLELRRVMNPTGSLYLHCDPTASHYLKLVMDSIFGKNNFRNEIVWSYKRWTASERKLPALHDVILCYGKGGETIFNPVLVPNVNPNTSQYVSMKDESGKTIVKRDADGNPIKRKVSTHLKVGDVWEMPIISPNGRERVGYPTQKPLALLERIIKASSNEGDLVLDPFCGCATACVAAERLGRQWIGIDLSPKAVELTRLRMERDLGLASILVRHRTDIPHRTDLGALPDYRTHKHHLYGQQEGLCAACRYQFPFRNMTLDHVVPRAKGGQGHLDNLQLLCGACNSVKGTGTMAELIVKLQEQGVRVNAT